MVLPQPSLLLCSVLTGSKAYGTSHDDSDLDRRGVFVGPIFLRQEVVIDPSQEDTVYFDLRKWAFDLYNARISALELLYAPIEVTTPTWERWISERDTFLSRQLVTGVLDSAQSQVKHPRPDPSLKEIKALCHIFRYVRYVDVLAQRGVFSISLEDPDREWYLGVKVGRDPVLLMEMQEYLRDSLSRLRSFAETLPEHPKGGVLLASTLTRAWSTMYGFDISCAAAPKSTGH